MKAETKAKIKTTARKIGKIIGTWSLPILFYGTIVAAWNGCVNSSRNEREIHRIDNRINELERQNEKLLNEAMDVTEGKEPAA